MIFLVDFERLFKLDVNFYLVFIIKMMNFDFFATMSIASSIVMIGALFMIIAQNHVTSKNVTAMSEK